MNRITRWWPLGLGLLTLVLAGCASRPPTSTQAVPGDAFTGGWAGTWRSEKTGHHGRLRCLLTKAGPNVYEAAFHAQWAIFSSSYTVPFHTRREGARLLFAGEHRLPAIFGGMYRFHGSATPEFFESQYASGYDYGIFTMRKVEPTSSRKAALRPKIRTR